MPEPRPARKTARWITVAAVWLLSSCGDSSLVELQLHPLANPNVTIMEPASQTATSGDISTGVLNGSSKVNSVTTFYELDGSAMQLEQVLNEIIRHAAESGCDVSRISSEEELPFAEYSVGCSEYEATSIRILANPFEITVNLRSSV